MTILHTDFETRSLVDLTVCGLDNYARHPSTRPILLSWAFDDDEVSLWQPHLEPELPKEVKKALASDVTISAWNAQFERNIFCRCLGFWVDYSRWLDPMIWARHLSLPGSLEDCGTALGLAQDEGKIDNKEKIKIKGREKTVDVLKHKFCEPFALGGKETLFGITQPEFHDWNTHPEDWKKFCGYCIRDTQVERTLLKMMAKLPLPEIEQKGWELDQKINERGIPTNMQFVENAIKLAQQSKNELSLLLKEKTQLENPNSRTQLLPWITAQGYPHLSLGKVFVTDAVDDLTCPLSGLGREVLKLRQQAAKTSDSKFDKIKNIVSADGKLRNQFAYMGASRTGRWASYGVQVQNLSKPTKSIKKNYKRAFELVMAGDYDAAKKEFPSIIDLVIAIVRSSFQAPLGTLIGVSDLNAIENRVIGWVANCDLTLRVFKENRCPYLDFGSELFSVDYHVLKAAYDQKDEDADEKRTASKPAVLGAGFGLGGGELTKDKYGNTIRGGLWGYAKNMGVDISKDLAHKAVKVFRAKRPKIVQLWKDLEKACLEVIARGGKKQVGPVLIDRKKREDGIIVLRIILPSGRGLHYFNAKIESRELIGKDGDPYEKPAIVYDGIGHGVGKKQDGWGEVYTYGGKLTENIVQGIARDLLLHAMLLADDLGAEIFYHAHDEQAVLINPADPFGFTLSDLQWVMCQTPDWAPGLPMHAESWQGEYYKKG